jgi:hypothetical protein
MAAEMGLIDTNRVGVTAERSRVYLKLKDFPRWRVFLEYILVEWRVFHGRHNMVRTVHTVLSRALGIVPGLQIAAIQAKRRLNVTLRPHRAS